MKDRENVAPRIEVQNLSKNFAAFQAVKEVSFDVKQGEVFAFLGPNGAGKTTTIKMLTTLLEPSSGKALVNGFDVATQSHDVRKSFGIVFQDHSLDDELTAFENMELHGALYGMSRDEIKQRARQLLEFVELWDRQGDLVKVFSGGMKRRLEIARGLMHNPKIIFLDEPTLGLDAQTRNHMWDFIKKLNKNEGVSVLFTTHYLEEAAKVADRIAIIDQGKIVAQGTTKELMKKTKTKTLEAAFLKLTGHAIRDEQASGIESMRMHRKLWGGR